MLLYHGSSIRFSEPSIAKCKPHRDFGRGFYLAEDYMDAMPMAIKNAYSGFVYTYELNHFADLDILELDGYSDEWLSFVIQSRMGETSNYDLVIGNMAGGGANLKSKFSKLRHIGASVDTATALMRKELTNTTLGIQYAFLTQRAISKLNLLDIEVIEREEFA